MQPSAISTTFGTGTCPRSQRLTVRRFKSNASAMASCVANPAPRRAALNSSGVMARHDDAAITAPLAAGNQRAVDERAVRILDCVARQHGSDLLGRDVSVALLANMPALAVEPIQLNPNVRHGCLPCYGWMMGHFVTSVNRGMA